MKSSLNQNVVASVDAIKEGRKKFTPKHECDGNPGYGFMNYLDIFPYGNGVKATFYNNSKFADKSRTLNGYDIFFNFSEKLPYLTIN